MIKRFYSETQNIFLQNLSGISQQLCYLLDASYSINECTAIWDVKNYSQFSRAEVIKDWI